MLSGAGASWIYDVTIKQEPLPIGSAVEILLGIEQFDLFHPIATMFQTVTEGSEAMDFAPHFVHEPLADDPPKDFLLIAGYTDTYFLPIMIDGLIAAAGIDLGGPQVNPDTVTALSFSGRSNVSLPVQGNIGTPAGPRTGAVLQFPAPAGINGHYVAFELPQAKYQYSCFFASIVAGGTATVPPPADDPFAPCP